MAADVIKRIAAALTIVLLIGTSSAGATTRMCWVARVNQANDKQNLQDEILAGMPLAQARANLSWANAYVKASCKPAPKKRRA